MKYIAAIVILSVPLFLISRKSLQKKGSHGYYRFFSWEAILVLLVFKIEYWFYNPFSWHQLISWVFLIISLWLLLAGVIELKRKGKHKKNRQEEDLFFFEKTSELVKTGIYKYIRHPLYSSLLFLCWGIYLKNPDWILLHAAILASLFLFQTARADEKECQNYFGEKYTEYMQCTWKFIPYII